MISLVQIGRQEPKKFGNSFNGLYYISIFDSRNRKFVYQY